MNPQQRREDVRTNVLRFLAERLSNAFEAETIRQRLNDRRLLDFEPEMQEIVDALAFLKGGTFVTSVAHIHGATPFFQVTSAGVLAHERGTLAPRPL